MKVTLRVGEDFRKAPAGTAITLRMAVENVQQDDEIEVTLNGRPVPGLKQTTARLLTAPLKPDQVKQGRNQVTLKLRERSQKSAKSRTVTALEIDVVSRENDSDQ